MLKWTLTTTFSLPLLYWFAMQPETNIVAKYKSILAKYKCILSKYKSARSTYKSILSTCKIILSKYKNILAKYKLRIYTFKVHQNTKMYKGTTFGTLETESPEPGTFLIPRVPRTQFPEPAPSKPREQNLTCQNPSNTETFETSGGSPEPEPVPGTQFLPGTAPARPEHTEIYIVQKTHSILLLGNKLKRKSALKAQKHEAYWSPSKLDQKSTSEIISKTLIKNIETSTRTTFDPTLIDTWLLRKPDKVRTQRSSASNTQPSPRWSSWAMTKTQNSQSLMTITDYLSLYISLALYISLILLALCLGMCLEFLSSVYFSIIFDTYSCVHAHGYSIHVYGW